MSQQEEDPSRYTRTLVVKPALSQMYDQVEVLRNGMQKLLHSVRRRPVMCVYLDLGISQTAKLQVLCLYIFLVAEFSVVRSESDINDLCCEQHQF